MDNEERPQEVQEQWQESPIEETQQAVYEVPQETPPAEESEESSSEDIEQN